MAKAKPTEYSALPYDTIIEVVAVALDGKAYIFDITIQKWQKMKKKPGVHYYPFQKGFSSFKDVIRTEYKE